MAAGRFRRARQGCIRATCLLLVVASLVFGLLAGIKAVHRAGLEAQRAALAEDLGPLVNIFVCITFAWQVEKLAFLQLVVMTINHYPTLTTTTVFTDNAPAMEMFREESHLLGLRFEVNGTGPLVDPYHLAWAHRAAMQNALVTGNFTAFMYLEDDLVVPWPVMQAWAEDAELLWPLGFQRSFFRVEAARYTGEYRFTDVVFKPHRTEHMERQFNVSGCDRAVRKRCSFLQLTTTYCGMWAATRAEVEYWIPWDAWNNNASFPHGVREAAATNVQWMRIPPGYENAAVVPFDPVAGVLAPEAAVLHASNRFCSKMGEMTGIFEDVCRMNISSYLIPDPWLPNSTVNCSKEAQRRQHEDACGAHNGTDYESNGIRFIKIPMD